MFVLGLNDVHRENDVQLNYTFLVNTLEDHAKSFCIGGVIFNPILEKYNTYAIIVYHHTFDNVLKRICLAQNSISQTINPSCKTKVCS